MRTVLAALAVAVAAAGPAAAQDGEAPQVMVTPRHADDSIGVHGEPGALSIDFASARGAGSAELRLIDGAWPAAVRLRFHGLAAFESLRVSAGGRAFRCDRIRIEGGPAGHPCRLDGEPAEPVRPGEAHFDVWLPRRLLADGDPLAIEWVDRWPK